MSGIKDFIYLDDERVRSYTAQLTGSVTERTEHQTAHNVKTGAAVKASGLSKLFVDTDVGAEYAFQRSKSETSTLHHAAFEMLAQNLENKKLINEVAEYSKPFSDIECYLRLVDYSVLAAQLDHMGLLMPLFDKVAGNKPNQVNKATAKQMKDVSRVIGLLYGNAKVLQLLALDGKKVLAQVSLDNSFSLPVQNLFSASSNSVLPGVWHVFGVYEQDTPIVDLPTGENEISQALASVSRELTKLKGIISATIDAPSVIPVAIYRILSRS